MHVCVLVGDVTVCLLMHSVVNQDGCNSSWMTFTLGNYIVNIIMDLMWVCGTSYRQFVPCIQRKKGGSKGEGREEELSEELGIQKCTTVYSSVGPQLWANLFCYVSSTFWLTPQQFKFVYWMFIVCPHLVVCSQITIIHNTSTVVLILKTCIGSCII